MANLKLRIVIREDRSTMPMWSSDSENNWRKQDSLRPSLSRRWYSTGMPGQLLRFLLRMGIDRYRDEHVDC